MIKNNRLFWKVIYLALFLIPKCSQAKLEKNEGIKSVEYRNGVPHRLIYKGDKVDDQALASFLKKLSDSASKKNYKFIDTQIPSHKIYCPGIKTSNFKTCLSYWRLDKKSFLDSVVKNIELGGCYIDSTKKLFRVPFTAACWSQYRGELEQYFFMLEEKVISEKATFFEFPKRSKNGLILEPFTIVEKLNKKYHLPNKFRKEKLDKWELVRLSDGTLGFIHSSEFKNSYPGFFITFEKTQEGLWRVQYVENSGE